MENKKIITRKILIDDSILPKSVMDVEQKVVFEKINGMWLSEHSIWDEYRIPQYDGVKSSIDIIPAEQVDENTTDETINVTYYPDVDEENTKEVSNEVLQSEDKSEEKNDDLIEKDSNDDENVQKEQKESEKNKIQGSSIKEKKQLSLVPDSNFNKFVKSLSIHESGIDWSTRKSSLIPFSKRNAWLRNVYEVEQNTKDLREVGMITLNQNGFRPQYYDE